MKLSRSRLRAARRALLPVALGAVLVSGLASPAMATPAPIDLNSASCPTKLVTGENDGCVVELQTLLNTHGFGLGVDGSFGVGTVAAVRTFQSETGIGVDGQVDPQTKAALYVSSGSVPDPITLTSAQCPANMVTGEDDGCVTELQGLLDRQGAHLSIDGGFGADTVAAVKAFQTAQGIGVDGQVGPQTKATLYGLSTQGPPAINLQSSQCPANIAGGELDGCVTTLQSLLVAHGASISVDGDFGANTLAAVKAFQTANGLHPDGQVGVQTKAALYGGVSTAPGAPAPLNLRSSSCPANMAANEHDGCVTTLQSFLNSWGAHLAVDGDFGVHTVAAVESYQAARGIGVDGQVGAQTKAALYNDGAYYCPPTGCPGQGQPIQPYVVAAAKAMIATSPPMPYSYAGGHATTPGPGIGQCIAPDAGYDNGVCYGSHTVGLDCSGFARLMYAEAANRDVLGSGSTDNEIANPLATLVPLSKAVPGDLIFFGLSTGNTDHVGIYAGTVSGVPMMYNAFDTGTNVREEPVSDADNSSHPLLGYYHYSVTVPVAD
ncbi:C40 family peptidase [Streptacidiphilus cavernicola]|uniref:Peptidoglycan-binding protein n=1 Tax=Streptacidiphilus cavernicola TaxID=3342716 RepID=A0ABV6VWM8_9ACTN